MYVYICIYYIIYICILIYIYVYIDIQNYAYVNHPLEPKQIRHVQGDRGREDPAQGQGDTTGTRA